MGEAGVVEYEAYETLPTHSLPVHLMAGALAGIGEHCAMFPIDSYKTRVQSLCPCPTARTCRTPWSGVLSIIREEGWTRPWRGVNSIAFSALPAHALYFAVYEKTKHCLTAGQPGHHPLAYGAAGVCATIAHDLVMNPAEVVKQRMQMWASPYKGCVECARCIYNREGMCAFYRSYVTQLSMNIPFQATHFVMYEFWSEVFNPRRQYSPLAHVTAGGLAGALAAAVTTPLDVVKTVLNTQQTAANATGAELTYTTAKTPQQPHCPATFRGFWDAAKSIRARRGLRGFFNGIGARVIFQVPSTAICWLVYESAKYWLTFGRTSSSGSLA